LFIDVLKISDSNVGYNLIISNIFRRTPMREQGREGMKGKGGNRRNQNWTP
jgi:hypothetical protein